MNWDRSFSEHITFLQSSKYWWSYNVAKTVAKYKITLFVENQSKSIHWYFIQIPLSIMYYKIQKPSICGKFLMIFKFRCCLCEVVTPSILAWFQKIYMFWKAMIPIRLFLILLMLFGSVIRPKIALSPVERDFMKFHEIHEISWNCPDQTQLYLENKASPSEKFLIFFPDHHELHSCQFLARSAIPPSYVVIFVRVSSENSCPDPLTLEVHF